MNFKKLIYFFFQLNLVVLYAQDFVHPIYQNHIIVDGENFEYITNDHLYKLNPKTKSLYSISIEITQKIGTFKLIKIQSIFLLIVWVVNYCI